MSLYGALFTGVSGLSAQAQKLGVISDNIANVSTLGFKRAESNFKNLVVNTSTKVAFQPGGALTSTRYHISEQGLIQATATTTDVAVAGEGFFVVNANSDGSGQDLYTRAGSFRQDENGDLKNANGFFLQAWPLDQDERLPGEQGNINTTSQFSLDSLQTVNIQSLSGEAVATTEVSLGTNLDASEEVFPGETITATMDDNSTTNLNIDSTTIIAPDETSATSPSFGLATTNNIARGDGLTITTGNGLEYDYFYGGFTIGRDIDVSGATNIGDGGTDLSANQLTTGGEITTDGASTTVTVTLGAAHGLTTGDQVVIDNFTFNPAAGTDTIPLTEINTTHIITVTGANTYTFTTSTASTIADANPAAPIATWSTRLFTGNILDAVTAGGTMISDLSLYTTDARSFTITTSSTSAPATFTYNSDPSTAIGQFNSLNTLAEAINSQVGLTARVIDGRLLVGSEDATEAVTFANVDSTGDGTDRGIDWMTELDLQNVTAGSQRFSTLGGLAALVDGDTGVSASVHNPASESTVDILVDDPLDTIRIQDYVGAPQTLAVGSVVVPAVGGAGAVTVTVTLASHGLSVGDNIVFSNMSAIAPFTATELNATHTVTAVTTNTFDISITATGAGAGGANADGEIAFTNTGSIVAELGLEDEDENILVASLAGGAYTRGDTGVQGPRYEATGASGENMASGDITPQYTQQIRVYDAEGFGHDVSFSYIKIDENEWAVEVYIDEDEISSTLVDGQIATGTIQFNGDGTLQSVSAGLTGEITINWTNGASPSAITLDLGTAGLPFGTAGTTTFGDSDGLRQFADDSGTVFIDQNGSPVGDLVSVLVDEEGFLVATYSNGENSKLYKIPLADFPAIDGLKPVTGTVFAETVDSGTVLLREVGESGVGTIVPSALEQSNVDLADELTDMIVSQRAYQANTRVISTTDELLEQLNQL